MLLAQVNRDTQSMEFQSVDGDPQQVTLCLTEAVTVGGGAALNVYCICFLLSYPNSFLHRSLIHNFCFADSDHIEGMDTVSLQAVTLVDGSTAYIQHSPKGIEVGFFCMPFFLIF